MNKEELIALNEQGLAAWNAHDADGYAEIFAADFVYTDDTLPDAMTSLDQVRDYLSGWFTAFPDMSIRQLNRVVGDDAVAGELEFTGTNSGPLRMGGMELPPTGRQITGHGTYFVRVAGDKVTEFHAHPNAAEMMMQLGMMPS
jgi:predicted ester cyclase